jgi:hypothetical protein
MVGDKIAGRDVIGFAYVAQSEVPDAADDQVLLDGDEELMVPPVRPLPAREGEAERCGPLPPHRLPADLIHEVGAVTAHLPDSIARLVERAPDPAGTFFTRLFQQVTDRGHLIWAVGGSVRDLVTDGPQAKVNDLDFSGTVPPGLMATLAWEVLAGMGLGHRRKVWGGRVCLVWLDGGSDPILEYTALAHQGFHFPVSGGDMCLDAKTRDLTVNSIHYDPRRRLLLDPTGRGLSDLGGPKRILVTCYKYEDPYGQASILLRLVQFVARWRGEGRRIDVEQPLQWAEGLPADLFTRIPEPKWRDLIQSRNHYVEDFSVEAWQTAARALGPMAVQLLMELDARSAR